MSTATALPTPPSVEFTGRAFAAKYGNGKGTFTGAAFWGGARIRRVVVGDVPGFEPVASEHVLNLTARGHAAPADAAGALAVLRATGDVSVYTPAAVASGRPKWYHVGADGRIYPSRFGAPISEAQFLSRNAGCVWVTWPDSFAAPSDGETGDSPTMQP